MVPIRLECQDCGHRWQGKPLEAREDSPRCGECQSREVGAVPGDGDDGPVLKHQGREQRLREALGSVPGVGEAGVEYATSMWSLTDASRGPEALRDVISEIEGVTEKQARRVASAVFQVEPRERDRRPLDGGRESADESRTSSTLDALIRAREAGLVGDDGGGTDAEAVAKAVSEAMAPALQQMSQTQKMLAESRQDGDSGLDELRQRVEELAEEQQREELRELKNKIQSLERGSDLDEEIARLRETRSMLEDAPTISAEAASEWSEVLHSLLDRAEGAARQRAMLGEPGADDRQPSYTPAPAPGRGRPGQRAATRPTQERPAPGRQANGGAAPAGASDGDAGEPADSGAEERAQEIRGKLGISSESDSS